MPSNGREEPREDPTPEGPEEEHGTEPGEPGAAPEPDAPPRTFTGMPELVFYLLHPGCLFWIALLLLFAFLVAVLALGLWGWSIWTPLCAFLAALFVVVCLVWLLLGLFWARLAQDVTTCTVSLSGPDCILRGESGVFRATGKPAGGSFSWSVGSGLREVQQSYGRITVKATGSGMTSTISVTYEVGGSRATEPVQVKLPRLGELGGDRCVCVEQPARLTARTRPPGCESHIEWEGGGRTGTGPAFDPRFTTTGRKRIRVSLGDQVEWIDLEVGGLDVIEPKDPWVVPSGRIRFVRRTAAGWVARVPDGRQVYTVVSRPDDCGDVEWTISRPGGPDLHDTGHSVTVTFSQPGRYVIRARCGGSVAVRRVSFCDFKARVEEAANYFGSSINFLRVSIDYTGTTTGASWVAHDLVQIGDGWLEAHDGCPPTGHYVHEFGHVWQYQHGLWQLAGGAGTQTANFIIPDSIFDAYDYGGAAGVRTAVANGQALRDFGLEEQCSIFEDDFRMKAAGAGGPFAADLNTLTTPALAERPTN